MGFFGYKRNKVEEGLRRSTRAVLIGGLFHIDHVKQYRLNEDASAMLYSEMLAHLIYCIGIVFNNKIAGKKSWATPQFMESCIKKEAESYEKELGQHPGMITSVTFKRLYEFEGMSSQQRASLQHIKDSTLRICKKDPRANANELETLFENKTREFVKILADRF
jgi:hypothetical protein